MSKEELHADIKTNLEKLEKSISENLTLKKKPLTGEKKKPKVLKLYEPEIEDNFDPTSKKRVGNKEKLEFDKLMHKMKREKKAAKKDIRADNAFLASLKAKELRQKDQDRIRKTRDILSGLGQQEGEFRLMQRKAGKKKRR